MKRAILLMLTAIVLLSCFNTAVFSHEVPDYERLGSISVTMRYGGNNIPGGSMTIYRVGDVIENDGNYSFTFSGDFAGVDAPLSDLESQQLIFTVASYIAENDLKGTSKAIDNNGSVRFYDLVPGLYILIQDTAANGYNCANPFLVSVPMSTDGQYIYDVDASAKAELTKNNDDPHEDTTPESGSQSEDTDGDNNDGKLPQTGQLKWPIPILTVGGAGLILVGLILCFGTRKAEDEN